VAKARPKAKASRPAKRGDPLDAARSALLGHALAMPGAWEDHPWGETVVKVKKRIFFFVGETKEGGLGLSVKLPQSSDAALSLPFTEPTGYGLGASGWVSARFGKRDRPPVDVLLAWIDESYRAIAPKTLVRELDAAGAAPAPTKRR
jgi:predicted DNA-binding protein (MmcQ/YjbR family)